MEFFIRIDDDDKIVDAKFRTFGCGSAIATSSMTTEMVVGKTLDEALDLTRDDVASELDGLPPVKMHCSNLAADALHEAIKNWRSGNPKGDVECEEMPTSEHLACKDEFIDNGLYRTTDDPSIFKDLRTLVVFTGDSSVQAAMELTKQTGRVILLTCGKDVDVSDDMKVKLKESGVKVLYESQVLEVRGDFEVEKVLIKNLAEDEHDEEYELFVDAVVVLEKS
jgi:nitrogen fixation NifU-like protein